MTTEVVVFSLKPDAAFSKVFSEKMAPTLHAHGAQNLLWGEAIGDPLMATMLADWKSLDDHKKFTESSNFGPHMQTCMGVGDFNKRIIILHVDYLPTPVVPATEVNPDVKETALSLYCFPQAAREEATKDIEKRLSGYSVHHGWAHECIPLPGKAEPYAVFSTIQGLDADASETERMRLDDISSLAHVERWNFHLQKPVASRTA